MRRRIKRPLNRHRIGVRPQLQLGRLGMLELRGSLSRLLSLLLRGLLLGSLLLRMGSLSSLLRLVHGLLMVLLLLLLSSSGHLAGQDVLLIVRRHIFEA